MPGFDFSSRDLGAVSILSCLVSGWYEALVMNMSTSVAIVERVIFLVLDYE